MFKMDPFKIEAMCTCNISPESHLQLKYRCMYTQQKKNIFPILARTNYTKIAEALYIKNERSELLNERNASYPLSLFQYSLNFKRIYFKHLSNLYSLNLVPFIYIYISMHVLISICKCVLCIYRYRYHFFAEFMLSYHIPI